MQAVKAMLIDQNNILAFSNLSSYEILRKMTILSVIVTIQDVFHIQTIQKD